MKEAKTCASLHLLKQCHSIYSILCVKFCCEGALCTVGENIVATIKMRNDFCYPLKKVIFPILR